MSSSESSLPARQSRYETLHADSDTSKELLKIKDDLWKYEIPRDPNVYNHTHRRERTTFGDGSSIDIDIQDAGVDAAIRKLAAIFSSDATAGAWSLVAKSGDELPTQLKEGLGSIYVQATMVAGFNMRLLGHLFAQKIFQK